MKICGILLLIAFVLSVESNFASSERVNVKSIQSRDDLRQLFKEIQKKPKQASIRREMATLCRELGYWNLSDFYQQTAEYLEGKQIVFHGSKKKMSWLCPESLEQARTLLLTSKEIDRLLSKGEAREALEHAEGELKSQGLSCRAMVEWSRVVLVSANDSPIAGSQKRDEELAVRWLLTAAEDIKLYPLGLEGKATTYNFLSDYFLSKKDYVTAYVSTFLAVKNLRSGDLSLVDENRLNEKLDFLKAVL